MSLSKFYGTYNYGEPMYGGSKAYPYSGHAYTGSGKIKMKGSASEIHTHFNNYFQHDAYYKQYATSLGYGKSHKKLIMAGYGKTWPYINPNFERIRPLTTLPGEVKI